MWFPKGTDAASMADEQEAKETCRHCPVMETCRQWALETRQEHGVWGGLTERDRASIRRYGRVPKKRVPVQVFASIEDAYRSLTEKAGGHVLWCGGREVVIGSTRMSPNQVAWRATRSVAPVGRIHKGCEHGRCVRHLVDQAMRDAHASTTERSAA
ncbi:MAG: WhiB family transcriptional regulator [Streptomyces sp.]|nr:WhiB family transcriptional regulator [Streptomyces sp.]